MTSVRAALFREVGSALSIEMLPVPTLQDGEVAVRVRLCTICASDLHSYHGRRDAHIPSVLGHEIVGDVVEVCGTPTYWSSSTPIEHGDRITWCLVVSCGECSSCDRDLPQKCESLRKFGHESINGSPGLMGGLAETCLLPKGTSVFPVPASLSDETVAPANCAVATAAAAIRSSGQELEGSKVIVLGAGMVGISICALAATRGASVDVIDPSEDRRQRARKFGAARAVDIDEKLERADLVFEASGNAKAIASTIDLLRVGGQIILVGSVMPSPAWSVEPEQIVRQLVTIRGVHNYAPQDLRTALNLLEGTAQTFPWHDATEAVYPLAEVNRAIEHASRAEALRIGVRP